MPGNPQRRPGPSRRPRRSLAVPAVLVALAVMLLPAAGAAADPENCLLCHRYRGLSRFDEEGELRLFFVNEDTFANSVHMKVECKGCHADVDEIPHEPAEPVDCLRECHITEPASERKFSHAHAAESLGRSVHSGLNELGEPKRFADDYPECKDCHDNPLYRPLSFFKTVRPGISDIALGRCRVCHESEDFIYAYYNHVTTRLHPLRSPKNVAEVCARCHDDQELVARHGLAARAGLSYEETFHGKAADMLDETIPDCLNCHVARGESVHDIKSKEDPRSPSHPSNKAQICAQEDCHPTAAARAADYRVHSEFDPAQSVTLFVFSVFFYMLAGAALLPLLCIVLLDLLRRHFPNVVIRFRRE